METNKSITQRSQRFQVADVSFPAAFHKASGIYFYDIEGNKYLDFSSGYGVSNLGWQHPEMVAALQQQAAKSTYAPPWMPTEEASLLSEKLATLLPRKSVKCLRAAGGGDANELLLKALYANHHGAVLSFERSYHGGSHATLGLGDSVRFHLPVIHQSYHTYKIAPPYCLRCPWGKKPESCGLECALAVEGKLNAHPEIKTFFAEPVIGSGGIITPPANYYHVIQTICKAKGVSLIFDEVLTGCGRTGQWLASQKFKVEVDGFSLAKGLASGYAAIGAAVIDEELLSAYKDYDDVSSSFAWMPLASSMALKNIYILEQDGVIENAALQGEYLKEQISEVMHKYLSSYIGEVRSCGLMLGVEVVENRRSLEPNPRLAMRLLLTMLKKGLMWCASWDYHTMIALPPLIISRAECDEALNIIESSAKELSAKLTPHS
jgi:4-aminobutyrate aminotransferase-like enzyme